MISKQEVQKQLDAANAKIGLLGYKESQELTKILVDNEVIKQCLVGLYNDAVSVICVTNMRVLVIDKRPLFLNIEDIRFEMISEVDFGGRLIDSSLTMHSLGKSFTFRSWHNSQLRKAYATIQEMVLYSRQPQIQAALGAAELKSPLMWQKSVSKFARTPSL